MKLILILGVAFLLLFLLERGYRRFWSRDLHVEVHFQSYPAREGEEACLTEIIENRKILPIPMLQVEFLLDRSLGIDEEENASLSDRLYKRDVFSVSFYQKISRTIPLKCRKRGYYHIGEANLVARGLQMEKNYYKDLPQDTFLYVYPGDVPIDRLKLPMHRLGGLLEGRRGMIEDPFAFAGMRGYDGTDPMNRINWKASARSGNLMVNLQNSTCSPRVACFVDVEDVTMWKHMEIHEEAIRSGSFPFAKRSEKGHSGFSLYEWRRSSFRQSGPGTGGSWTGTDGEGQPFVEPSGSECKETARSHLFRTSESGTGADWYAAGGGPDHRKPEQGASGYCP